MRNLMIIFALGLIASPAFAAGDGNPFAGTIFQGIAAAIVFIAVVLILRKAAWGPILKGLQDREGKIKSDLENAEAAAKQAQETLEQYQKQMAEAQEESRKMIEQARADAERLAAQLKSQAEKEVGDVKNRAERDIKAAKEQAVTELYAEVATLSTQVAGKILQREISADDQQALVEQSINEMKAANN